MDNPNEYGVEMSRFDDKENGLEFSPDLTIRQPVTTSARKKFCIKATISLIIIGAVAVVIASLGACVYVYNTYGQEQQQPQPNCHGHINKEQWAKVDEVCPFLHTKDSTVDYCNEDLDVFNMTIKSVHALYRTLDQIKFPKCPNYEILVKHNEIELGLCEGVTMIISDNLLIMKQRHTKKDIIPMDESKRAVFEMDALDLDHGEMLEKILQYLDYIKITDGYAYVKQNPHCNYVYA